MGERCEGLPGLGQNGDVEKTAKTRGTRPELADLREGAELSPGEKSLLRWTKVV